MRDLRQFSRRNQRAMRRDGDGLGYFHHLLEQLHRQLLALAYCRSLHEALSYSCNSFSFRHLFQMLRLHQDVHRDDLVRQNHRGVVRHQVVNDKDQLFVDRVDHLVVDAHRVDQFSDLVVVDAQQIQDEQNLVLVLTLAVSLHQVLQVLVDVDHLVFQMDYFQDELVV